MLAVEERAEPALVPGSVNVALRACALNHLDLWVRRGLPNLKHHYPHVLGADGSGVVQSVAEGVTPWRVGDEVVVQPGLSCGLCVPCQSGRDNLCRDYGLFGEHRSGLNAEVVNVPVENLVRKPASLSFEMAAALPVAYMTAWQMLVDRACVQPGETVFVHAAGSGVGVAAIQIAKLYGARVIASASSEEKRQRALALGATHAVDSAGNLAKEVRAITDKAGVDIVFEHTGAATWGASLLMAKKGGRIVTCGATSGFDASTDLRHVFYRQLQIMGSTMANKAALHHVVAHAASGALMPIVGRTMPLWDLPQAHALLEARGVFGKIVLTLGDST